MAASRPPEEQDTEGMIRAAVERKRTLFFHFPDLDHEDRFQECWKAVTQARPTFDPARASWSTFVARICNNRQIDLWRQRTRQVSRETVAASGRHYAPSKGGGLTPVYEADEVIDPVEQGETFEGEVVGGDGQLLLVDWLHAVFVHAKRLTNTPAYRMRRTYDAAQLLALAALKRKLQYSIRQTRGLMLDRPDLCRIIAMNDVPGHNWFQRLEQAADVHLR
jgi:hypothetical protein